MGADLSPPRKSQPVEAEVKKKAARTRHDSDSDLSPPRTENKAASASGRQTQNSNADLSPPRKKAEKDDKRRHDSDADLSPPRRRQKSESPAKMTSGLRSGMISGKELKDEAARVRAERKAAIEAAPDEETG